MTSFASSGTYGGGAEPTTGGGCGASSFCTTRCSPRNGTSLACCAAAAALRFLLRICAQKTRASTSFVSFWLLTGRSRDLRG